MKSAVCHVNSIAEANRSFIAGNLTGNSSTINIRGSVSPSDTAQMIINARVGISTNKLDQIVCNVLETTTKNYISITIKAWQCICLGYPNPTHRFNDIL